MGQGSVRWGVWRGVRVWVWGDWVGEWGNWGGGRAGVGG